MNSAMNSLLTYLLGLRSVPKLFYAPKPALLQLRTSSNEANATLVSLEEFVEKRCPSLHDVFTQAWWLPGGNLQTGYCVVGDFSRVDKVEFDRTLLRTVDGGTIGLDFTPSATASHLRSDTPVIVVLHGLTGGSHESYVRAILAPACSPPDEGGLGYRAVVVNFRGCAGVPLTSPQLYSAGHTDDIRTALLYISTLYPDAPLLGIGFSLGANVLTRYLAQEGEQSRLSAGCAVGCPWDLLANSQRLRTSWFHRQIYSKGMGANLKALARRHLDTFKAFPDAAVSKAVPGLLEKSQITLGQFDETITRLGGGSSPPFPFPTADDYYVWASSHKVLGDVKVPLLALNAEDDPIVSVLPIHDGNSVLSPWVVFATTQGGGHLGWFEEGSAPGYPRRWYRRPVLEWLQAVGNDMIPMPTKCKPIKEVDGFLKEEGRDDIGCKVMADGGHIVGVEGEGGLLAGL